MFDTVDGLPLHPLVVHDVIVLLLQLSAVVLADVARGVQVYRVGDSGARAAWGNTPSASDG